jgi:hypothetical protein
MRINSRGTARFTTIAALLFLSALVAACGGRQSVASRSAAALREAQQKGLPISGNSHGGHSTTAAEHIASESMDHSNMPGMSGGQMTGMSHGAKTGMDDSQTAGMDHSNMAGMSHGQTKGEAHSSMPGMDQGQMAGMDHSKMPGMQQGQNMPGMQHGAAAAMPVDLSAPTRSSAIAQLNPSATLRPDPFDQPAPVAVAEASKAGATEGHTMQMENAPAAAPPQQQQQPSHQHEQPAPPPRPPEHSHHGGSDSNGGVED